MCHHKAGPVEIEADMHMLGIWRKDPPNYKTESQMKGPAVQNSEKQ